MPHGGYRRAVGRTGLLRRRPGSLDAATLRLALILGATAALLARTNKKNEAYPNSHVIEFPMFLKKHGLEEGVNPGILNGMYRIVRSSLKAKTPIAEFVPKQGSPEYLVALLYRLEEM